MLRYLAQGTGVLILSSLAPAAGAKLIQLGVKSYFRKKRFERDRFLRDLNSLQKRELVDWKELTNGELRIVITKFGKQKMLQYQLDDMRLKIPNSWDGKWRLIMFDIPHKYRAARDALRHKLRDLDFYALQKSVFITPYPCEDEIDFITAVFNVRQYVLILYVSNFEGEEKLRHHFGI